MKKIIKNLIAVTAASLMLASCNQGGGQSSGGDSTPSQSQSDPAHVHTFASEWSYNESSHWHAATCGHDVKDGLANHVFGEWSVVTPASETQKGLKKHVCTICEYEATEEIPMVEHTHTFDTSVWEHDENTHWHPATCGHDVKGEEAPHTYGEWGVKTAATASEDGVEARKCSVCEHEQTRTLYRVGLDVAYPFATTGAFTVDNQADGVHVTADATGDSTTGYDGFYLPMAGLKVEAVESYTFVIRNNNTERGEYRIAYRDTSVQPRTFANSSVFEDYKIESLNGRSNTKLREWKDGFIKFNIESGDTAKITVPMVSEVYDQFVLMLVHSLSDVNVTIIQTGYVIGEHNFEEGYHYDENYHWHECLDEGCDVKKGKAPHTWASDESKEDVAPTSTESGVAYKKCHICGATKEIVLPPVSEESTELFRAENIADLNSGLAVADEDGTEHGNGVKFTSSGAINEYTRVFSLVLTDTPYSVANSKAAEAKFSFYLNYEGLSHASGQSDLKKCMTYQLCNGNSKSENRATDEARGDASGCSVEMLDNNWLKINMVLSAFNVSAGAIDSFDRINFKMGTTARFAFTEANQTLVLAGFESSGFVA